MKNVLLTAIGCPGASSIMGLLKNHYRLYGVDCDPDASGFHLIDGEVIAEANEVGYEDNIISVVKKEKISYILPMSTNELLPLANLSSHLLAAYKCKVLIGNNARLGIAIDKGRLYEYFSKFNFGELNFIPKFYIYDKFVKWTIFFNEHFYSGREWFVKPCISNGSRGLFKITDDYKFDFSVKPVSYQVVGYKSFDDFVFINRSHEPKSFLISEFLTGKEWSVDCVIYKDFFVGISRVRDEVRCGICTKGHIELNDELISLCKYICKKLKLEYCINLQFIETKDGFKLLEINPRVSGTIVLSSQVINLPKLALELAEGNVDIDKPVMIREENGFKNMVRIYKEIFY